MVLLAANITTYGPTFKDYLGEVRGNHPIVLIGEHHLCGSRVEDAEREVGKAGYRGFWSLARSTGRGGFAGGTAILVDAGVEAIHDAAFEEEPSSPPALPDEARGSHPDLRP